MSMASLMTNIITVPIDSWVTYFVNILATFEHAASWITQDGLYLEIVEYKPQTVNGFPTK